MRLATWNVNSIRARVDRVVGFLDRWDVDVLAVQETKCRDDQFPYAAFEAAGYEVAHVGFSQWNGVAIVSRVGIADVERAFPGQPGFAKPAPAPALVAAEPAVAGDATLFDLAGPQGPTTAGPTTAGATTTAGVTTATAPEHAVPEAPTTTAAAPGDAPDALHEARALGATCGGVRVWSLYIPNGRAVDVSRVRLCGRARCLWA